MHAKALAGESMSDPQKPITPPELGQLRRDMIAAIDETLALVNPQWTIRELRIMVGADGRVESSPLLRRRPRRHTPSADFKINLPGSPPSGGAGSIGGSG